MAQDFITESTQDAVRAAERTRERMAADAQRQRDLLARQQMTHSGFSQTVRQSVTPAFGDARRGVADVGAGIFSNVSAGYGAAAAAMAPAAAYAGGLGMNMLTAGFRPGQADLSRGIEGSYFSGTQSFGGLLYDAGGGSILNQMTGGLFFKGHGQQIGMSRAAIEQRAQQELAQRFADIGNSVASSIPLAERFGMGFRGMRGELARDISSRYSFLQSGGMAGGNVGDRGFALRSDFVQGLTRAREGAFEDINKDMGYALSSDDARSLGGAFDQVFSAPEMARLARMGSSDRNAKFRSMNRDMKKLADDLKMSAQEVEEFVGTLDGIFEAGELLGSGGVGASVAGEFRRGRTPLGTRGLIQARAQYRREAIAMGIAPTDESRYANLQSTLRDSTFENMVNGAIDPFAARMYGGRTSNERMMNYAAATQRIGMNVASDPNIAAMSAANQGGLNRLASGTQGGFLGFAGDVASARLSNPYADVVANYDPATRARVGQTGDILAFRQSAQLQDRYMTSDPRTLEALRIRDFQEKAGIQNRGEAITRFRGLREREGRLRGMLDDKSQAATALSTMEGIQRTLAPDLTEEEVARMINEQSGMGRDVSAMSDFEKLVALDDTRGVGSTANQKRALMLGRNFFVKENETDFFIDISDSDKGVVSRWAERGHSMRTGTGWITRHGNEGIDKGNMKRLVNNLLAAGYSPEDINKRLQGKNGWSSLRVSPNGEVQMWSHGQGKKFVSLDDHDFGDRIGDDKWEKDFAFNALTEMQSMLSNDGILTQGMNRMMRSNAAAATNLFEDVGSIDDDSLKTLTNKILSDRTSTNATQRRFQTLFNSGAIDSQRVFSEFGKEASQELVRFALTKSGAKMGEEELKKKVSRATESSKAFADFVSGQEAGTRDWMKMAITNTFIQREQGALKASGALELGASEFNPMRVIEVESIPGAAS